MVAFFRPKGFGMHVHTIDKERYMWLSGKQQAVLSVSTHVAGKYSIGRIFEDLKFDVSF